MNKEFLSRLKSQASSVRVNYKGRKLENKYIIIESDDWGAIRTPSKESLKNYSENNIDLSNSVCKYDCLENQEDFEKLFGVLSSITDLKGNHAKLRANTIVNPFFETYKKMSKYKFNNRSI